MVWCGVVGWGVAWCTAALNQMRAHQGGVLDTDAVEYMQRLLGDPSKQHSPGPSTEPARKVIPLSPAVSRLTSVARTDSGNVDM